jgi:hypothetical protein
MINLTQLLKRKPANRLGLRGAIEVKEHVWLKYYPWKELYEKALDSPFIPKAGDNFDVKYTSQIERLGNDTKERYEGHLRNESLKEAFKCFTFMYLEGKETKIFNNPHTSISSISVTKNVFNLNNSTISAISGQAISSPIGNRMENSLSIENKFLKIKFIFNLISHASISSK